MLSNLNEWLAHLEKSHPQFLEPGLERVKIVAQRLAVLTTNCPVMTIAGTNGKGSCVALAETILVAAGYQVGTYTSPHLIRYNERIRINKKPIEDDILCESFKVVETARKHIPLTYFEFSTLAALWLFKQAKLDVIILEVGIGGRLDAVNIIDADIAVITSIDLDHTELLGNTREAIGYEKAGIIRKHKTVVYGDFNLPNSVKMVAEKHSAPLYCQTIEFGYEQQITHWNWWSKKQQLNNLMVPKIFLPNASTTLQAIELLAEKLPISYSAINTGLENVFISGRFQIISEKPLVILDVAHNPAATHLLAQQLHVKNYYHKTWAIVGMLADKDVQHTLEPMIGLVDEWLIAELPSQRSCKTDFLLAELKKLTISPVNTQPSIREAYAYAMQLAAPNDRIIIFGSFFTVAEVLAHRYNRQH